MAMCFRRVIKQQLGDAFVAAVGNRAAGGGPGEQALLYLDALRLGLVLCETDLGHFEVGVDNGWDSVGVERCSCQLSIAMQFTVNPLLPIAAMDRAAHKSI